MELSLQNGGCSGRYTCKNLNKKVCHSSRICIEKSLFGLLKRAYVKCNYYERK